MSLADRGRENMRLFVTLGVMFLAACQNIQAFQVPHYSGRIQPLTENVHVKIAPFPISHMQVREQRLEAGTFREIIASGQAQTWQHGDSYIIETVISKLRSGHATLELDIVDIYEVSANDEYIDGRRTGLNLNLLAPEDRKLDKEEIRRRWWRFPEEGFAPNIGFGAESQGAETYYRWSMSLLGRSNFKGREVLVFKSSEMKDDLKSEGFILLDIATGMEIYSEELGIEGKPGAETAKSLTVFEIDTADW